MDQPTKTITPLPKFKIFILGTLMIANMISVWMIFSFLPFMINDFYPDLSLKELGYKAGILGSAFSVGSLFGNLLLNLSIYLILSNYI
jgi:hypothetical protein